MRAHSFSHIGITVSDFNKAVRFYADVFGCPLVGVSEGLDFEEGEIAVAPGARLWLFSDGAFEVCRPDGSMWAFDDFLATLTAPQNGPESRLDSLVATIRGLSGRHDFNDDFSMVQLSFS